jgi:acyl-CoA synthetase (AMP-forming)/AMP-acid ligase II
MPVAAASATRPSAPPAWRPARPLDDPFDAAGAGAPAAAAPASVAQLILEHARTTPAHPALVLPRDDGGARVVRYGALARLAAAYARGLRAAGVGPGDRVCVLAPPTADFYALALAVLAGGMTLVLADGRLAPRRVLGALADARAGLVVGPPALMRWWPLVPALWRARRFVAGGRARGARPLAALRPAGTGALPVVPPGDAPAVVSFTSGSTGRATGVVRTHAVLRAQHDALGALLPAGAGDVHLTSLPLAALHALCGGGTAVLARPDRATPAEVAALLAAHGVTSVSGAPAFVRALAEGVGAAGPAVRDAAAAVRRVAVGGAPVSRGLCALVRRAFPAAVGHVVYGATEAEPIAAATMDAVERAAGRGFLVGRPAGGTRVALVPPGAPMPNAGAPPWPPAPDTEGEVVVRGAHVAAGPRGTPDASWHRTGDLARADARGRLWLLGGVATAVPHHGRTLHPFEVEAEALADAAVRAAGLVAHRRAPAGELAVELDPGADAAAVARALRARLDALGLPRLPVRVVAHVPVDPRHASKVRRADLARRLARAARTAPGGSAR